MHASNSFGLNTSYLGQNSCANIPTLQELCISRVVPRIGQEIVEALVKGENVATQKLIDELNQLGCLDAVRKFLQDTRIKKLSLLQQVQNLDTTEKRLAATECLLKFGVKDVDIDRDKSMFPTALFFIQDVSVAQALLNAGSDPNIRNCYNDPVFKYLNNSVVALEIMKAPTFVPLDKYSFRDHFLSRHIGEVSLDYTRFLDHITAHKMASNSIKAVHCLVNCFDDVWHSGNRHYYDKWINEYSYDFIEKQKQEQLAVITYLITRGDHLAVCKVGTRDCSSGKLSDRCNDNRMLKKAYDDGVKIKKFMEGLRHNLGKSIALRSAWQVSVYASKPVIESPELKHMKKKLSRLVGKATTGR